MAETSRMADTKATATSSAGAAATATITAATGMSTYITSVAGGYDTAATAGTLTIKDGTTAIFVMPLTVQGAIHIEFEAPLKITRGANCSVVVSAGGGSVLAYANLSGYQI